MKFFRKVRERREPPGLERTILLKLPLAAVGSTVVPLMIIGLNRWWPTAVVAADAAKRSRMLDYFALGIGITAWTAVLTVGIGCWVVEVMKGPHYEADSYEIDDEE